MKQAQTTHQAMKHRLIALDQRQVKITFKGGATVRIGKLIVKQLPNTTKFMLDCPVKLIRFTAPDILAVEVV